MTDIDGARLAVESILASLRRAIDEASRLSWSSRDGLFPLLLRSVVRRQFESLDAISQLVADDLGFAAAPLLRPACEELIWIKYLLAIERRHTELIVRCMSHDEVMKALRKQRTAAGKKAFRDLGLVAYLRKFERVDGRIRGCLRDLSEELGWPVGLSGKKGALPPVRWVAEEVDENETYDLIYHATSRFVHFSPTELLRRTWYSPEREAVTIDSGQFGRYWAYFSLYWGVSLFLDTTLTAADQIGMGIVDDADRVLEAAKRLGEIGMPPIITAEELYWGDNGETQR